MGLTTPGTPKTPDSSSKEADSSEPLVVRSNVKIVMDYLGPLEEGRAAEFLMGCGAGGDLRYFPQVTLRRSSAGNSRDVEIQNQDFDFFTISPGEAEVFVIPITCGDPGMFALHFVFTYFYDEGWVTQDVVDDIPVACPRNVSLWRGVIPEYEITGIEYQGKYRLSNGQYEKTDGQ